jgi:predicted ATPase
VKIESLKIKNYRALKDVEIANLQAMNVFVGANGTGKSTLFDVFGFLKDSLIGNVTQALMKRGGFKDVVSRESSGPIFFEIKFRDSDGPLVTYQLEVSEDNGKAVISKELLQYRRGQRGRPWKFLDFSYGRGRAITNEYEYGTPNATEKREEQNLESPDILAIKGLGQFTRFQQVSAFRRLIENWHVSDFHISDARPSQDAGYAEHVSPRGDNAALVAQFMFEQHPDLFDRLLRKMEQRVPECVNSFETPKVRI